MTLRLRKRRKQFENDCWPSWMPMCIRAKIDFMRKSQRERWQPHASYRRAKEESSR